MFSDMKKCVPLLVIVQMDANAKQDLARFHWFINNII